MTTSTHEEILVGGLAIRPRIEPAETDGVIAIHEFDVPAGASTASLRPSRSKRPANGPKTMSDDSQTRTCDHEARVVLTRFLPRRVFAVLVPNARLAREGIKLWR